ncbi:MAG: CpaD family pilus assembly lipoprotein [Rhizobiaceae bacterium]|nr:CpaD family pilus assembly lipoprotein [Rhizobiaceae bacterium]
MTNENTRFRFLGLAAAASILAVSAALTSCAARPDRVTTSSVPDDYRTRHPITLAEVQHSLDIPVGTGERKLTTPLRDLVRGFAQDYLALSSSTVSVALPASSVNAGAAHAVRSEVRQVLIDAGVKPNRIVMTTYDPAQASASSPIRLGFVAVTAITGDCGQWPTDLFGPSIRDNTNWENFGCATQQNLAAQIANPADLVGPRGMTPIDAQRRAEVISIYRKDGNPAG